LLSAHERTALLLPALTSLVATRDKTHSHSKTKNVVVVVVENRPPSSRIFSNLYVRTYEVPPRDRTCFRKIRSRANFVFLNHFCVLPKKLISSISGIRGFEQIAKIVNRNDRLARRCKIVDDEPCRFLFPYMFVNM